MTNFQILQVVMVSLFRGIVWVLVLPWLGFVVVASELLRKLLLWCRDRECAKLN